MPTNKEIIFAIVLLIIGIVAVVHFLKNSSNEQTASSEWLNSKDREWN